MENQEITSEIASVSQLLKSAWESYKRRAQTYASVMAVGILITVVPFVIFGAVAPDAGPAFLKNIPDIGPLAIILIIIGILAVVILGGWAKISLYVAVAGGNENIGVRESFARGWKLLLKYFGVAILTGLAVLGGFMFFIIPGIILGVFLSFSLWVLVVEKTNVMQSILGSWAYVKGFWWKIFGRFIVIGLISIVISMLATLILGSLARIFGAPEKLGEDIAGIFISLTLAPFAMVYIFTLFIDVKRIRGVITTGETATPKTFTIIGAILGIFSFLIPIIFLPSILERFDFAEKEIVGMRSQIQLITTQAILEAYKGERGNYPETLNNLVPQYLDEVPKDESDNTFSYKLTENGASYNLCLPTIANEDSCITPSSEPKWMQ